MVRLIRRNSIKSAVDTDRVRNNTNNDMVPLEKIREILPKIEQLSLCQLNVYTSKSGELIVSVDGKTYKTQTYIKGDR